MTCSVLLQWVVSKNRNIFTDIYKKYGNFLNSVFSIFSASPNSNNSSVFESDRSYKIVIHKSSSRISRPSYVHTRLAMIHLRLETLVDLKTI